MASIVEKESGLPQELPKIAGLYLHRLAHRHAAAGRPHRDLRTGRAL